MPPPDDRRRLPIMAPRSGAKVLIDFGALVNLGDPCRSLFKK